MLIVLESILWVIRFFFGACIFSFLNVVIDRLPRAESVVNGRSHCTNCGTVMLSYFGILLVVALIDWDTQIIYDRFHIFILILAIANIWLVPEHGLIDRLIGALIISVPMLLLALAIPGAFGGGDIKLMAVSGAFLGTGSVVCAMFFGLLTGGAYGAFMLKSKKLGKNDVFAFGPFLAFGLALAALYGNQIVTWYLHFL